MNLSGWLSLLLVFAFVVTCVMAVAGASEASAARRLRMRLEALRTSSADPTPTTSVLRERYLRQLPPLERMLERLPQVERLGLLSVQAGREAPAYRILLLCLLLGAAGAALGLLLPGGLLLGLAGAIVGLAAPIIKLLVDRRRRLNAIEEQLPDALDLMARALRAGNPLNDAFKFISEEMPAPIATEFGLVWSYINYGVGLQGALGELVTRVPNVGLRTMTTAILVQRETGGNLAEILSSISSTVRSRARFQRKLRTLTAEGRASAIALALVPFVLAGGVSVISPTYLPLLLKDPLGPQLIVTAAVLMCIGVYWISRIVRVEL